MCCCEPSGRRGNDVVDDVDDDDDVDPASHVQAGTHVGSHAHAHTHARFDKHTMQEGHRLLPKGGERGWGDAWHLETLVSYVRVCFCKSLTMGTNI